MRYISSIFLALVLSVSLSAQTQRGLKGTFNVENFPEVSFVWNTPNPDTLDISQFALFEDNVPVGIELSRLPADITKSGSKNVLFLWEDMANHNRQSDFTRELLTQFFSEIDSDATECFEIAVFNQQKNNANRVLEPLVGYFTSDLSLLGKAVSTYQNSNRYFSSKRSDLYLALLEGIELLKQEPKDHTGIIVVVTAGLSTKGSITEIQVRQEALSADIPIYVVNYPLNGSTQEINTLAEKTFGLVTSSTDVTEALVDLLQNHDRMSERLEGCDYEIRFTSNCEHDAKQHTLQLIVDNVQQFQSSYEAPNATFGMWLGKHWWLALVIVVLIGGGTVLAVLLTKKKKEEKETVTEKLQNQILREREESERRHSEAMEELRREQQVKDRTAKETAKREQDAANEERLSKIMQAKDLYPRLKYKCGKESSSYTITKPCVTLGRDSNNDVILDNPTVSSQHAEIEFDGSAFEVRNKSHSYSQGIIVNGQFCQKCVLKNGDMIGLGEVVITFYL